jgi:hypothetical protein
MARPSAAAFTPFTVARFLQPTVLHARRRSRQLRFSQAPPGPAPFIIKQCIVIKMLDYLELRHHVDFLKLMAREANGLASERSDCSKSYRARRSLADRATARLISKPKRYR